MLRDRKKKINLVREIEILRMLDHSNIVKLHRIYED